MPRALNRPGARADERYPPLARLLHWGVALGVLVQIGLGWAAETASERDTGARLLHLHFQLGMLLLALMVLRAGRRLLHGLPPPATVDARPWRRRLAACVHAALYLLLFVLPLSGYVIWVWMDGPRDVFGLGQVPRLFTPPADDETWRAIAWYVHCWSAWALAGLVALHVAAALWHQWVLRDRLVSRRLL